MSNLNIITAFIFGLLAFVSPCTFPLIPSFLSFLLGISIKNLEDSVYTKEHRNEIIINVLLYILGASVVLVFLGTTAGAFGTLLKVHRLQLQQIGGIFVIIFGIYIAEIIKISLLSKGFELTKLSQIVINKFPVPRFIISFFLGIVFTLGWIPCISPILSSILILAASSSSAVYGGFLLFIYSLGLNIPFFFVALLLSSYLGYFKSIRNHVKVFSRLAGILLIIFGILLIFGGYNSLIAVFYSFASRLSL